MDLKFLYEDGPDPGWASALSNDSRNWREWIFWPPADRLVRISGCEHRERLLVFVAYRHAEHESYRRCKTAHVNKTATVVAGDPAVLRRFEHQSVFMAMRERLALEDEFETEVCSRCSGTGEPWSFAREDVCSSCNGAGQVTTWNVWYNFYFFEQCVDCLDCEPIEPSLAVTKDSVEHLGSKPSRYDFERKGRLSDSVFWPTYKRYLKSPEWSARRKLVLRRDNRTCQACLTAEATEAHHLTYRHVFNEPLFDLVAICSPCHESVTTMDREGWGKT